MHEHLQSIREGIEVPFYLNYSLFTKNFKDPTKPSL